MNPRINNEILQLLDQNKVDDALVRLDALIASNDHPDDRLFYLRGNAFRKKSNWQEAINNYLQAVAINPDSPANSALEILNSIMNFRHKDLYNP
ncbi:MAG: tetratricopeptide repeat protein [Clostridium sp.]|nr:tetratricopeptide repeat protein [Clostridium sp.]